MGAQTSKTKTHEENIEDMIELHNRFRAVHGVEPLTLDPRLNEAAQEWAERLQSWGGGENSSNIIGENFFCTSTTYVVAAHAVNIWYSGKQVYDWSTHTVNPESAKFTQIVWKSTKRMGAGYVTGEDGTFVVAVYVPPGNIPGQYPENVLPEIDEEAAEKSRNTFKQYMKSVMARSKKGSATRLKAKSSKTTTTVV